jgi:hypothetical protein
VADLDVKALQSLIRRIKITKLADGRYQATLVFVTVSDAAALAGESVDEIQLLIRTRSLLCYWPKGRDAEAHINLYALMNLLWGETRAVPADWMDPEPEPTPIVRTLPALRPRPTITKKLRFKILERDGFTCRYCGRKGVEAALQVDHVVPVSAGGTDDEDNLVAACTDCNLGKRAVTGVQPPALEEAG